MPVGVRALGLYAYMYEHKYIGIGTYFRFIYADNRASFAKRKASLRYR